MFIHCSIYITKGLHTGKFFSVNNNVVPLVTFKLGILILELRRFICPLAYEDFKFDTVMYDCHWGRRLKIDLHSKIPFHAQYSLCVVWLRLIVSFFGTVVT